MSIGLSNFQELTHVYKGWKDVWFLRVYNWVGMYWNQNLVTFAMNSNAVVVVPVLIIRCELNVNVFSKSCRNLTLLIVFDLKISCRGC